MEKESNSVIALRTSDMIRQEAADWLVKLDNRLDGRNLSAEDLTALRTWLAQDVRHGQVLKRQAAIWADMDIYATTLADSEIGFWPKLFAIRQLRYTLAFICCALLTVSVWLLTPGEVSLDGEAGVYATAVGVQNVERLSDGSIVHLNTDSLIEIDFTDTERRITLVRGEVMFDVMRDTTRPFIVHARGSIVRALGTKFVVRLSSTRIRVTVAEGEIQLTSQAEHLPQQLVETTKADEEAIILSQGQTIEVGADQTVEAVVDMMDEEEIEQKFSWVNGRLVFDDETLENIVNEVNRYTSIRVVIVDQNLKGLRLSGRFQIGDTEALLEAIEISRKDIHISRNNPGNMIYISRQSG